MNRLATTLAAALLVFPTTAWADELPAPAVRVVSGARTSASTPPRTRPTTVIPVAPSRDPLAKGMPRPAVTQSRSAYLRRLRGEVPAPTMRTRATTTPDARPTARRRATPPPVHTPEVSAPVRTSFPRTAARRNLTIPAAPGTSPAQASTSRSRSQALASGSPDGPPRGRNLAQHAPTARHGSRLPAPAVSAPRGMDTTSRRATAIRPTSRPARRTTPARATSRPAPVRPSTYTSSKTTTPRTPSGMTPPRVAPAPVKRRALTVPTQPVTPKAEPDGSRRSLLKPPAPGCEYG